MKILRMVLLAMLCVLALTTVANAQYVPVQLDRIEIDDIDIEDFEEFYFNEDVRLDLERGEEFEVELLLEAFEAADDVIVRAVIDGYEFSDIEPITDMIGPFDLDANITYKKKMTLRLPEDVDVDGYNFRLTISDRDRMSRTYEFNLLVDTQRHLLRIDDVNFNPGRTLTAGQALLGSVRVENKGQKDEDDVRVEVSIPALGLESVNYIEEIENGDDEEETEEFFLRLPKCAEPGVYDVAIEVQYNRGRDKVTDTRQVTILENEACAQEEEQTVVVVQQTEPAAPQPTATETAAAPHKSPLRTALEVILIVLVVLLVLVGLIIVLTRLREE